MLSNAFVVVVELCAAPVVLLETYPTPMKMKGIKMSFALLGIIVGEAHEMCSKKV